MNLNDQVTIIPKVGPASQKKLERLGIQTIEDLIFYFPQKYEDLSKITLIKKVKPNEKYCCCGRIMEIEAEKTW